MIRQPAREPFRFPDDFAERRHAIEFHILNARLHTICIEAMNVQLVEPMTAIMAKGNYAVTVERGINSRGDANAVQAFRGMAG